MRIPLILISIGVIVPIWCREMFSIDERWICIVKRSCSDCLRLSHCSWCPSEKKCFSKGLSTFKDFCKNETVQYKDYGFSFDENAECACTDANELKQDCTAPGALEGSVCSGRGKCVCGRCICDPQPDPDHPTKMVVGDYCDFDNFSCDGPKCSEGPYSISEPVIADEDNPKTLSDGETVEHPI